jgi:threonine 3-dehydrogenase
MRALVKHPNETGLRLDEVPVPSIGPDDVLIEVHTAGICGTDIHIYNWDDWAQATIPAPMTVGHEFAGTIVEVGSNVSGFEVGEIVGAEGHVVCGRCRNCLAGRRHLCQETKGIGVNLPGAFADFVSIPKTNIWRHIPGIDLAVAAIFDPFGNAVHTALEFPVLGEDVLITGAGPIGLMAAAVVAQAGARNVVITDVNPYRLDLAKRMGATRAVDVRFEDLQDVQDELGMMEGFDVALEMSGQASALDDILQNTIHGANVALLGIPSDPFPIDWSTVIFNMINLKGIYGREMFETWYKMNVLIGSGLDISPVITHRFIADDYDEAFSVAASHESGKVLINWTDR